MTEKFREKIDLAIKKFLKSVDFYNKMYIIISIRDYTLGFSRSTIISVVF